MLLLIQTDEGRPFCKSRGLVPAEDNNMNENVVDKSFKELRMIGAINSSRPAFHLKPKMTRDVKFTNSTRMNDNADMNLNGIYNYS